MKDKVINIQLTKQEAIVLFNFVNRLNDLSELRTKDLFEHQSEQRVLYDIECLLEKEINELFDPNFDQILSNCKDSLKDCED